MADERANPVKSAGNSRRNSCLIRLSTFVDCAGNSGSLFASQRLMKNQRSQFPGRFALLKSVAAACCLVFLCSCTSTVYDMRQLDQPVVLNNNPFLISRTAPPPTLVRVDTYSATASNDQIASQDADFYSAVNTAQLNAFLRIGGTPNCSIRNVTLNTECYWLYLVLLFDNRADIEATGEVAEIKARLLQPPLRTMGQSLTNQPALQPTVQN